MIESHEGESCRLFDQAIYIYLISCRIKSGFRVGLLNQASQLDSSARIQLLNLIRHFFKKIPIRLDTFRVEYSTRRDQSIYTYLISCRVGSSFRVELSSQASQLDSSARIQLLNSTRHFFKKISIRLDTFRIEYSTRTQVLDSTRSVYKKSITKKVSKCDASMFYVLREKYDEELHHSLLLNFFIFIQDIISSSSSNQEADLYSL